LESYYLGTATRDPACRDRMKRECHGNECPCGETYLDRNDDGLVGRRCNQPFRLEEQILVKDDELALNSNPVLPERPNGGVEQVVRLVGTTAL